jgi:hypothetical protein
VGQGAQDGVGCRDAVAAQTAFDVPQCFLQGFDDGVFVEWFKAEEVAAAEERGDDVKSGVVRGATDEAHVTGFDVGQEQVLLGFVETVDFVYEQDGAPFGAQAGNAEYLAQFGGVGEDGVDADTVATRGGCDDFGEGRFPASGRTVKEEASEGISGDEAGEQAILPQKAGVSAHFGEGARAHPGGERRAEAGRIRIGRTGVDGGGGGGVVEEFLLFAFSGHGVGFPFYDVLWVNFIFPHRFTLWRLAVPPASLS